MGHVEFFFDLSSPWTRLAFHNVQPILKECGASVSWRPFLVGGVFNAVNPAVYQAREQMDSPRMLKSWDWLREWAQLAQVPMNFPSAYHPLRSVAAMRFCCVLEPEQAQLFRFAEAAFDAYFGDQLNLDDPAVLIDVANRCELPGEEIAGRSVSEEIKARLRSNTEEAIRRGAFGSPSLFVDELKLYFGNDQLPLVRQALMQSERPLESY